jgi:hypothetical protein
MSLLNKHLEGYVPDGRQIGIACNTFLAGIDQFTEAKVIHGGTVHYKRPDVRNNNQGAAVMSKFQAQICNRYIK